MQNNKKTESMYWKGGIGTRLQSSENSVFAFFNNSLYMMTAYSGKIENNSHANFMDVVKIMVNKSAE